MEGGMRKRYICLNKKSPCVIGVAIELVCNHNCAMDFMYDDFGKYAIGTSCPIVDTHSHVQLMPPKLHCDETNSFFIFIMQLPFETSV